MALPPKADLHDILQFRPRPIGDPVPWWTFQHLEQNGLTQLAQISMQRQRVEPAAQNKAVDAAIEAVGKADVWRDNLDERRATIRMRIVSRSGTMIVAARHERKSFNLAERRSG
jgi:hypothetical protein